MTTAAADFVAALALTVGWFAEFYVPPAPYLAPLALEQLYARTLGAASSLGVLGLWLWTAARALVTLGGFLYWRNAQAAPSYVFVLGTYAFMALAAKSWRHALFMGARPLFAVACIVATTLVAVGLVLGFALDGQAAAAVLVAVFALWAFATSVASIVFVRAFAAARLADTAARAARARTGPRQAVDVLAPIQRTLRPEQLQAARP